MRENKLIGVLNMKLLISILIVFVLCSCATKKDIDPVPVRSYEEVAEYQEQRRQRDQQERLAKIAIPNKPVIEHDKYSKSTSVIYNPRKYSADVSNDVFYFGYDTNGSSSSYQLIFISYADDWRFFNSCADSSGNDLRCKIDDHNVLSGGTTGETLTAIVSRAYLNSKIKPGLDIKLYGKRGTTIYNVEGKEIKTFLDAVDSIRQGK